MSKKLKVSLFVVGALVVLGGGAAAYSSRNRGVVPVIAAKVETQDIVDKVKAVVPSLPTSVPRSWAWPSR